jgi:ribokinase
MFGERLPRPGETVNCREFVESDGGKGANAAVAAARIGASVALIIRLGRDESGERAARLFEREGIETSLLAWDDDIPTGAGFVVVDDSGHQLLTTYGGASARLTLDDVGRGEAAIAQAAVLIVQGEIPSEVSLAAVRLAGASTTVILDPGPVEPWLDCALAGVDILAPNEHEAALLIGCAAPSAEDVAAATGVPSVVLHRGAAGVEVFTNGVTWREPSVRARVVIDTTGAGDAFCGALAAGLAEGFDLKQAVRLGTEVAAISVSRRYCIPSYPRRSELSLAVWGATDE